MKSALLSALLLGLGLLARTGAATPGTPDAVFPSVPGPESHVEPRLSARRDIRLPAAKGAERLMNLRRASSTPARLSMNPTPSDAATPAPIQVRIFRYQGWERSLALDNGVVEAVVVPAIGRVMQFRFRGRPGPFWEDPALHGKAPDPASTEWGNFGGDKTWPAPQSEWPKITPRAWPPPVAFDSLPVEAAIRRDAIVLRSSVDPHYGIRTERVISLDGPDAAMRIVTTYEKVEGAPVEVGVWIITQLEDPVLVLAPLPSPSLFPEGYNRQSGDVLPANLKVENGLVSLTRDPARATKIGTDASRLLWVGKDQLLLVESPRLSDAESRYPDQRSSAEIYTNPDPRAYVELEMLGPLRRLAPGDAVSQTNTYRLFPRTHPNPIVDASRVLDRRGSRAPGPPPPPAPRGPGAAPHPARGAARPPRGPGPAWRSCSFWPSVRARQRRRTNWWSCRSTFGMPANARRTRGPTAGPS